jgi:hypothetical protein
MRRPFDLRRAWRLALVALAVLAVLSCRPGGGASRAEATAGPVVRILFVGNSYTFVNDLPGQLKALAASADSPVTVETESVTVGSATMVDHTLKTGALQKITSGGWTYVILQGQSVEPASSPDAFERGASELARRATSVGAIPVFYETWARAAGNAVYGERWSGGSPAALQKKLHIEYEKVAHDANARLVPAGEAWARALEADPRAPLFAPDGSHPAPAGTYLTACVFYAVLTGRSPVGLGARPGGMSAGDGARWQGIAREVSAGLLPDGSM